MEAKSEFETCVKFISGERPNSGDDYRPIFNMFRSDDLIWSDIKNLKVKKFIDIAALDKAEQIKLISKKVLENVKDIRCNCFFNTDGKSHIEGCRFTELQSFITKLETLLK